MPQVAWPARRFSSYQQIVHPRLIFSIFPSPSPSLYLLLLTDMFVAEEWLLEGFGKAKHGA